MDSPPPEQPPAPYGPPPSSYGPGPGPHPPAYAAPPPRRRTNLLPWAIGGGIILLACISLSLLVFNVVGIFTNLDQENKATLALIEQFMQAGEQNTPQTGYALFSPGSVTLATVSTLYQTRRDLFDGYEAVHGGNYRINTFNGTTSASIEGRISYKTRADAPFTATLVRVNGHWALTSMQFQEGVGP